MSDTTAPAPTSLLGRLKAKFTSTGDANEARARRRQAIMQKLTDRLPILKIALFVIGYLWVFAIPLPELGKDVYMDENALSPGHVRPNWAWSEVHSADVWLGELEQLRDQNASSARRAEYIADEFRKLGLAGATQKYSFTLANETVSGVNAYAVYASPRISGTEAVVISASWHSLRDQELNLRGIATVLGLAKYLKKYSSWAKDLVFVVSDGYLDGMQAWLNAYHNTEQKNLEAETLPYPSGVIWTALSIDYACHSFSHLGVFHEGVNGRLPNQDLINSFERLSRWTAGTPVVMYDYPNAYVPSWLPKFLLQNKQVMTYLDRARNAVRHYTYQVRGRPSGIHGLFHRHRIDAFTIYANCATGPHGFYAIGRAVESTLKTMNNLLERLHASFFFYILASPVSFNKIGTFIPSAILIAVAMMFQGLTCWVDAGWREDLAAEEEKTDSKPKWIRRNRKVLPVVLTMVATHILGVSLFTIISSSWFVQHISAISPLVFMAYAAIPLTSLAFSGPTPLDDAPFSQTLKALNLCFASTIISITSVLNFSLALTFAVLLGIPLSLSAPSVSFIGRVGRYAVYTTLALGWLVFLQDETKSALWYWEIASVWFAPVICTVYVPLVLQAGIATLRSS